MQVANGDLSQYAGLHTIILAIACVPGSRSHSNNGDHLAHDHSGGTRTHIDS